MPIPAGTDITAQLLNSLPLPMDTLATGSVSNSVAETVIGTFANGIPVGDPGLVVNGGYKWTITGTWDCTATPTIRFRVRLGSLSGPVIFDSTTRTAVGGVSAQPYFIQAFLIVTATGSGGTFDGGGLANIQNNSGQPCGSNDTAAAINTLTNNQIVVTAQYGTASASNTARTTGGTMGRL